MVVGADTTVWPGVTLRGETSIGAGCELGPQTTITDSTLGDGAKAVHSFLTEADGRGRRLARPVRLPAARRPHRRGRQDRHLRRGQELRHRRRREGPASLLPGRRGCGREQQHRGRQHHRQLRRPRKHRTTIGDGVKTGVDTSFIAPVSVGDGAYTGAGSVIAEDVPEGALGISRSRQANVEGYADRKEKPPHELGRHQVPARSRHPYPGGYDKRLMIAAGRSSVELGTRIAGGSGSGSPTQASRRSPTVRSTAATGTRSGGRICSSCSPPAARRARGSRSTTPSWS